MALIVYLKKIKLLSYFFFYFFFFFFMHNIPTTKVICAVNSFDKDQILDF